MSDTAAEGLAKCRAALQHLAPRLSPNCTAATEESILEVLERIYTNEGAESAMQRLTESPSACAFCSGKPQHVDLEWHVDVAKRRMWPKTCVLVCNRCHEIRDLPSLVKKLCFARDHTFSSRALRHFLEVNGHDAAKSHLFQDAISVAHAMLALQKGLKLTPSRGPPLQELLGAPKPSQEGIKRIKTKKTGKKR